MNTMAKSSGWLRSCVIQSRPSSLCRPLLQHSLVIENSSIGTLSVENSSIMRLIDDVADLAI